MNNPPLFKSQIIDKYVPSKDITKALVGTYLDTIEGVNRLFHIPTFELELKHYWENPTSARYDWLAQLLTVLALGTRVMEERIRQRLVAVTLPYPVERYLRGASKCLAHLSYPFHASLETVRTLCLMATAKKASLFSCHERDACGPLLETALSMCLMLGLDKRMYDGTSARRTWIGVFMETRVWTTVRYMYLHHVLHTGVATHFPSSAMEPCMLANVNDCDVDATLAPNERNHSAKEWTDSSAELLLSRSLSLAFTLVSLANHPTTTCPEGVDLISADALIRTLLRKTDKIYFEIDCTWKRLQRCMLIVFFRRLLITIYHLDSPRITQRSLLQTSATSNFSRLATTECAISILVQQRSMLEDPVLSDAGGRVVAELFKEDFLFASLVIGSEWTRNANVSSSLARRGDPSKTVHGPKTPFAGRTVLHGLYWCRELWAQDMERSICNFAAYSMLGRLLDILGGDCPRGGRRGNSSPQR